MPVPENRLRPGSTGLEHDDRDLATRLGLIGRVLSLVHLVGASPQPFALFSLGHPCAYRDRLPTDLDLDVGLGREIVKPARISRGTTHGRDHGVRVFLADVEEGCSPPCARPTPHRAQQKHGAPCEIGSDAAVGCLVEPLVCSEKHRDHTGELRTHGSRVEVPRFVLQAQRAVGGFSESGRLAGAPLVVTFVVANARLDSDAEESFAI